MDRDKLLPIALKAVGLIFIFAVWPMMALWPSGWRWEPHNHEYEQMIIVIYATLGVFLLLASRNPAEHLSLLRFTVWSSVAHGAIMTIHALADSKEHWHLVADVPAVFLVAAVLGVLLPPEKARRERISPS
jgi:hypothetical protein